MKPLITHPVIMVFEEVYQQIVRVHSLVIFLYFEVKT